MWSSWAALIAWANYCILSQALVMMTDTYGMRGTQDFCLVGGKAVDGFLSVMRQFYELVLSITVAFPILSEVRNTAYSHHIPTITSHLQCTLEGYENLLTGRSILFYL